MEFKRPPQSFHFQVHLDAPAANHLRIVPLFTEDEPEELAREVQRPELSEVLKKHYALGSFSAKAGQILNLPEQSLLLGGMGKWESWHPEKACELFRLLGTRLASLKDLSLEFVIRPRLLEALKTHRERKDPFSNLLALDLESKAQALDAGGRPKANKKAKQNERDEEQEESEFMPDYISDLDFSDLICQLRACMDLGAEPMELLKSKGPHASPKKSKTPIPVLLSSPSHTKESELKLKGILKRAQNVSEMLHGARYLASLPGNYMNPENYEKYARALAQEFQLKIKVFDEPALKELGCGGILAVGQGSAIPPRMIVLEYQPKKKKVSRPLLLVGKGITFDTGGISLKPPAEMHEMKYDMCGSALALHSIALAAAQKLELPVAALLGIAENMPDGQAIKPGDVYKAYDGSTVEIQNTDAEGRLVLGDVLAYGADNYDPLCILDFATLTGACVVALGHDAAAVMTASQDLHARIKKASQRSLDRSWPMPHWFVYGSGLKSEVADQRNIAGRAAGTLSAMRFLARFVPPEIPWAHFDIAGTAWRSKGFGSQGKGATGWGLRLIEAFMQDLIN